MKIRNSTVISLVSVWLLFQLSASAGPIANKKATQSLVLSSSRAYTLGELTSIIRKTTTADVYVEQGFKSRLLFVSKGAYDVPSLLQAIEDATGLTVRNIETTQILTAKTVNYDEQGILPQIPTPLLKQIGSQLSFMNNSANLRRQEIPFDASVFASHKSTPFMELSQEQQNFVKGLLTTAPANGMVPSTLAHDNLRLQNLLGSLSKSIIQFGTSDVMLFVVYRPSATDIDADDRDFLKMYQVYYDVSDMLDNKSGN